MYKSKAQYRRHKETHPEEAEAHRARMENFDDLPEHVDRKHAAKKPAKHHGSKRRPGSLF